MTEENRNVSDSDQINIQRLLQQIDAEYAAAHLGLSGLASGVSLHRFITARMEGIEQKREQLVELVGDENLATRLVIEQMNK